MKALLALLASLALPALAAAPQRINFQGRLLDNNKNPRNGSFSMTFRICNSETADCSAAPGRLWFESQTVQVSNGIFAVQLGSVTAIPQSVFAGATTYLEIQVETETLSPRERLVAAPYAFRAMMADDLKAGATNYIWNTSTLQAGATFYVGSATVNTTLTVGGTLFARGAIIAGTGSNQITTAAGLLDAAKLTGTVPNASLDTSSVTKMGNAFNASNQLVQLQGSSLPAVSAALLSNVWPSNVQARSSLGAVAMSTTETEFLSTTITVRTASNRVLLMSSFKCDNNAATASLCTARIYRLGSPNTLVMESDAYMTATAAAEASLSMITVDSPGAAGTYVYSLRGLVSASTVNAVERSIVAIEIGP